VIEIHEPNVMSKLIQNLMQEIQRTEIGEYRHVLTGQPHNGKSSTCKKLLDEGYIIGPESARPVLKKLDQMGLDRWHPKNDMLAFQPFVIYHQLTTWIDIRGRAYFDRLAGDNIAYLRMASIDVPDFVLEAAKLTKPDKVYLLDALPEYKDDRQRYETDPGFVADLHMCIDYVYRNLLGCEVVTVPILHGDSTRYTKVERAEFILRHDGLL